MSNPTFKLIVSGLPTHTINSFLNFSLLYHLNKSGNPKTYLNLVQIGIVCKTYSQPSKSKTHLSVSAGLNQTFVTPVLLVLLVEMKQLMSTWKMMTHVILKILTATDTGKGW